MRPDPDSWIRKESAVAKLLSDFRQVCLQLRTPSGSNTKHQDMERVQNLEGPDLLQDEKIVKFFEKAWSIGWSAHLQFNKSRKTSLVWLLSVVQSEGDFYIMV